MITCNGAADFRALGLPDYAKEFDVFDLHSHFRKPSRAITSGGFIDESDTQPIGLRSLYFHYYKIDMQHGVHSARRDAEATLELFIEQYTKKEKLKNVASRENDDFARYSVIQTLPK